MNVSGALREDGMAGGVEDVRQQSSRKSIIFAGVGSVVALVLVMVASPGRALGASSRELEMRERRGHILTSLWDEDAVGKALTDEIRAAKKSFMQEQLRAHTKYFGVHITSLQSSNATADGNSTANGTDTGDTGIAFDSQWFANW
jgi:hypothetical protein